MKSGALKTENLSMGATYVNEKVPSEVIFLADDDVTSALNFERSPNLLTKKRFSSKSPTRMLRKDLANARSPESPRYSLAKVLESPNKVLGFPEYDLEPHRYPKPFDESLNESMDLKVHESKKCDDKCFAFLFKEPVNLAAVDAITTQHSQIARGRMINMDRVGKFNTSLGLPPRNSYSAKGHPNNSAEQMKRETDSIQYDDISRGDSNIPNQATPNDRQILSSLNTTQKYSPLRNKYSSPSGIVVPNSNPTKSSHFRVEKATANNENEFSLAYSYHQPLSSFYIKSSNPEELKQSLTSLRKQLRKKGIAEKRHSVAAFQFDLTNPENLRLEDHARRLDLDFAIDQEPILSQDDIHLNANEFEADSLPVQSVYVSSKTKINLSPNHAGERTPSSKKYAKPHSNSSNEYSTFVSDSEHKNQKNPLSNVLSGKLGEEPSRLVKISEFGSKETQMKLPYAHVNSLLSKRQETVEYSPIRSLQDCQLTFGNLGENRGSYEELRNSQTKVSLCPDITYKEIESSKIRKNVPLGLEIESFTELHIYSRNNNIPKTLVSRVTAQSMKTKSLGNKSRSQGAKVRSRSEDPSIEIEYHVKGRGNTVLLQKDRALSKLSNSQCLNLPKISHDAESKGNSNSQSLAMNSTPISSSKRLNESKNQNDSKSTTIASKILDKNQEIDSILQKFKYFNKEAPIELKNGDLEAEGNMIESSSDYRNLSAICSSQNSSIPNEMLQFAGMKPDPVSQSNQNLIQKLKKVSNLLNLNRISVIKSEKKIAEVDETKQGLSSISQNWVAKKSNYFDCQVVNKELPPKPQKHSINSQPRNAEARSSRAKIFRESQQKYERPNFNLPKTLTKLNGGLQRSASSDSELDVLQKVVESKVNSSIVQSNENYSYSNSNQSKKEVETIVVTNIFSDHKYKSQAQKRDSRLYSSFDSKACDSANSKKGSYLEYVGSEKNQYDASSIYHTGRYRYCSIKSVGSYSLYRPRSVSKERVV